MSAPHLRPAAPHDVRRSPRDAGVSLVEVLVAMTLFGVFSTVLLGFAVSTADVTEQVRATGDVNGESRLAVERMTRELRQAAVVEAVTTVGEGAARTPVAFTVWVDFDGNGVRDLSASDPEVLTYRWDGWDPGSGRLTLTADDASGSAVTRPVLAEVVTRFDVQLNSSLFEADADGDGTTTWRELDAAVAYGGNGDGLPNGQELRWVDLVAVAMTVRDAGESRDYSLQADLRNRDRS